VFTGLVEEIGHVRSIQRQSAFQRLEVRAERVLEGLKIGDSINIDGACQTVVDIDASGFAVETIAETLAKTTLGLLQSGRPVNLERALRLGDRMGGHIVQGHVDGVGHIAAIEAGQGELRIRIAPPKNLRRYIAAKGSITVDGTSLTIAAVDAGGFTIAVIPHTFDNTVLSQRRSGDSVNLEVDVIARYIESLLAAGSEQSTEDLSFDTLRKMGY
jgi:riboflavin synthase